MADRRARIGEILRSLNPLDETNRALFSQGFQNDYQIGRDDTQQVFYRKRDLQGLNKDAPMAVSMVGNHQGVTRTRELLGKLNPQHQQALVEADMQLRTDMPAAYQVGQFAGTAAADLTQDTSRSVWWLINALQATGQVITDATLQKVIPELWGRHAVTRDVRMVGKDNKVINSPRTINKDVQKDLDYAYESGMLTTRDGQANVPKRGYSWMTDDQGNEVLAKSNYSRGMLAATAIPTGVAINNGLGLLTPFGGAEGFKAAAPDPEDPTRTNNIVSEVAQKYILGKTGNLLPYSEFKQVRPDVSLAEYKAYQADKFDNSEDWNPLDGDVSLIGGALKANTDGILGPEVSMLGRSLPVTTGIIPFTTALAGTAAGARYGHMNGRKGAMGALVGGLGGVAAGTAAGSIIENERRRRNGTANGELLSQ